MSALGRFGRFTLFSPRVSHSNTCRLLSFVCFGFLFGFVALVCFCFLFCECLGIPNSPRSLDLDDRQGLIARSAMQQKKKRGGRSLSKRYKSLRGGSGSRDLKKARRPGGAERQAQGVNHLNKQKLRRNNINKGQTRTCSKNELRETGINNK